MTVTTTGSFDLYETDGVQDTFVGTFPALAEEDAVVYLDNTLIPATDYTFNGDVTVPGWSVTLDTTPTIDRILRLQRETPQVQETVYTAFGPYKAKQHESDFDYAMFLLQEVSGSIDQLVGDDGIEGGVLDLGGRRIINLGDARIDDSDPAVELEAVNVGIARRLINESGGFDPTADATISGVWDFTNRLLYKGFDVWEHDELKQPAETDVDEVISGTWRFGPITRFDQGISMNDRTSTYRLVMAYNNLSEWEVGYVGVLSNHLVGEWVVQNPFLAESGYELLDKNTDNRLTVLSWSDQLSVSVGDLASDITIVDVLVPKHYDGSQNQYFMLSTKFYDPTNVALISSDPNMIAIQDDFAIDDTTLLIQADQPLGIPKLSSGGKIKLSQIPLLGEIEWVGIWDASANLLPADGSHGDVYIISVEGTLNVLDPDTGLVDPTLVVPGDYIIWGDSAEAIEIPTTGWYHIPSGLPTVIPATQVTYDNSGSGWLNVDVQNVLDEIWDRSQNVFPIDYTASNPIETPIIIRSATAQTAALQQWFPDAGALATEVGADGHIRALGFVSTNNPQFPDAAVWGLNAGGNTVMENFVEDGNMIFATNVLGDQVNRAEFRSGAHTSGNIIMVGEFLRLLHHIDSDDPLFYVLQNFTGGVALTSQPGKVDGDFHIQQLNNTGVVQGPWMTFFRDGEVALWHNLIKSVWTDDDGLVVQGTFPSTNNGGRLRLIGEGVNGPVVVENFSGRLRVRVDTAGANLTGMTILPSGIVNLMANGGSTQLSTQNVGGVIVGEGPDDMDLLTFNMPDSWKFAAVSGRLELISSLAGGVFHIGDATGPAATFNPTGEQDLYFNRTPVLFTANRVLTNSGADVADSGNNRRPIGYNNMPTRALTADTPVDVPMMGRKVRLQAGVNTITVDTESMNTDGACVFFNQAGNPVTFAQGAGVTIQHYTGTGTVNGNVVLSNGGVLTLTRRQTSSTYLIWGGELIAA